MHLRGPRLLSDDHVLTVGQPLSSLVEETFSIFFSLAWWGFFGFQSSSLMSNVTTGEYPSRYKTNCGRLLCTKGDPQPLEAKPTDVDNQQRNFCRKAGRWGTRRTSWSRRRFEFHRGGRRAPNPARHPPGAPKRVHEPQHSFFRSRRPGVRWSSILRLCQHQPDQYKDVLQV